MQLFSFYRARSDTNNQYFPENIQDVLGRNTKVTMATMVQYEIKPEKLENRVLVLTEFRLIIVTAKIPCKVRI